jgi:hypothetical protein
MRESTPLPVVRVVSLADLAEALGLSVGRAMAAARSVSNPAVTAVSLASARSRRPVCWLLALT